MSIFIATIFLAILQRRHEYLTYRSIVNYFNLIMQLVHCIIGLFTHLRLCRNCDCQFKFIFSPINYYNRDSEHFFIRLLSAELTEKERKKKHTHTTHLIEHSSVYYLCINGTDKQYWTIDYSSSSFNSSFIFVFKIWSYHVSIYYILYCKHLKIDLTLIEISSKWTLISICTYNQLV